MTTKNESADNRTMATDAVATIGMLIPEHSGRDAIHLAVEPVAAGERLAPGQHIGFLDDGTVGQKSKELLGIVDPFLNATLFPGDRFWLVVYPRTITSLRHVWAHPSFAPAEVLTSVPEIAAPTDAKEQAESWIRAYCARIGCTFEEMIDHTETWVNSGKWGEYWIDGGRWEGEYLSDEYWPHYMVYSGKAVPEDKRHNFFSCSC